MNLSQIIHPEIVLGKRGPKHLTKMYNISFELIRKNDDGEISVSVPDHLAGNENAEMLMEAFVKDSIFLYGQLSSKLFKDQEGECYYIPSEFVKCLSKIDRNIPVHLFKDDFTAYFHFGKDSISDESGLVCGGYISFYRYEEYQKMLITYFNDEYQTSSSFLANLNILENSTLSDVSKNVENMFTDYNILGVPMNNADDKDKILKKRYPIYLAILNAAIYTKSQDPDIRMLEPLYVMNKRKAEKARKKLDGPEPVNTCSLPISILNWNYHEERSYSKESTWVASHPRWQRCGEALKDVRLIFVKGHSRHFKNIKEEDIC